MADIVLDGVYKTYSDGYTAVKDLNLEIGDGEFMILVGPSGCGKSTALNMIAGLEDISAGELRIGGEVVNKKAPRDRDIAMVFQSYALYPHMTVRDNIAFALKLAKRPKEEIDRKVNEAADILDLQNHLERKPANLSGGQRQRVAMGRAIVRSPKAFLMDEPLSNLDAKLRVQMRAEVARIQHRLNTTTVYVTHDQTEAMTLGDRVAIMLQRRAPAGRLADGALQQPGEPVRRRLHRVAGHELPAGDDRRRHGEAADGRRQAAAGGPRADRARRRRQEADRRHPAGGLRGRRAGRRPRRAAAGRRSRRSSTSSRRWARSTTSTSASRPTQLQVGAQMDALLDDQGGVAETTDEGEAVVVARLSAESRAQGRRADRGLARRDEAALLRRRLRRVAVVYVASRRMSASLGVERGARLVAAGSLESTSSPVAASGAAPGR